MSKDSKFKAALVLESEQFQHALKQLRTEMSFAAKQVKRLRHTLGGHISRGAIRKTLRDMPGDMKGLLQLGEVSGKTRYKFVAEIVLRMMLPDVPEHELLDKLEELLKETAQLIPVFRTIDDLMAVYARDRKLAP